MQRKKLIFFNVFVKSPYQAYVFKHLRNNI